METEPDITTAASGIANKSLEVADLQHPILKKTVTTWILCEAIRMNN
jgi:hypothetical protein